MIKQYIKNNTQKNNARKELQIKNLKKHLNKKNRNYIIYPKSI